MSQGYQALFTIAAAQGCCTPGVPRLGFLQPLFWPAQLFGVPRAENSPPLSTCLALGLPNVQPRPGSCLTWPPSDHLILDFTPPSLTGPPIEQLQRPVPATALPGLNEVAWGRDYLGALVTFVLIHPGPFYPKRKWRLREGKRLPQGHTASPILDGVECSPSYTPFSVQASTASGCLQGIPSCPQVGTGLHSLFRLK